MINLNKLSTDQRTKLGLKERPMLTLASIEDMFCPECRQLLKPIRKERSFRQKRKRYDTFQLVAWCYQCDAEFDVDHWIEVVFQRREVGGLTIIVERKAEYTVYPTSRQECKQCDKGTVHTYRSIQTRSADEPETTFYRCTVCGSVTRENV
ncbi:hypothetical protein KAR91_67215 [Candidatus Pacearchaeota archaeon]|nr:hypothetical protein [Candidatus Pacearchaeota archaeon]